MTLKMNLLSVALLASMSVAAMAPAAAAEAAAPSADPYVAPKIKHEKYGDMKVVVPLTDPALVGMKLRNINNMMGALKEWGGKADIRVVMYANGVAWLKNPDAKTKEMLDKLRGEGVRFEVCNNTLHEQNINFHSLYGVLDADIVPSGFAEVAFLQNRKHFAVEPAK